MAHAKLEARTPPAIGLAASCRSLRARDFVRWDDLARVDLSCGWTSRPERRVRVGSRA